MPNYHRGDDPEAIAVADTLGLSFDGMQNQYYQFTVQRELGKGITFYVKNLSDTKDRLAEKYSEFGIKGENR